MPKHHKHIVEKWSRVVENIDNSALSAIEYCKRNNLSVKTYYSWKSKLKKFKSQKFSLGSSFQELKLKEPPAKESSTPIVPENIEILFNDKIRILVTEDFNESVLLKTIKVLDKAIC